MKNKLRIYAKEHRKSLNINFLSDKICKNIFSLPEYKMAKNIFTYYPIEYEVNLLKILDDSSKKFYLPKVNNDKLVFCPYIYNKLKNGKYNIPEPDTKPIDNLSIVDLIIVPALAADKSGFRIGYGKGFYDRFLNEIDKSIPKLTTVFSDLFIDNVYPDKYDVNCDIVVTDKNVYRIKC